MLPEKAFNVVKKCETRVPKFRVMPSSSSYAFLPDAGNGRSVMTPVVPHDHYVHVVLLPPVRRFLLYTAPETEHGRRRRRRRTITRTNDD